MKAPAFVIATIVLLATASLVSGISAAPTSITLTPTADDFAYFLDTLLSGESFLAVRGSSNLSGGCLSQAEAFLKFDLGAVPEGFQITNATLTLGGTALTGSMTMGLFGSYTDTWSEDTAHIVWAGRPAQDVDLNSTAASAPGGATIVFSTSSSFVDFLNDQLLNDSSKIATIGIEAYDACSLPTVASQQVSAKTGDGGTVSPVLTLNTGPVAVALASFDAVQQGDHVLLTWETVSELENSGFNLYRGTSDTGWDMQLNETLIPSQSPGSPGGFVYTWEDRANLVPGTTYYYWLEDMDIYGVATMHGPVSVDFTVPTVVTVSRMMASAAGGRALPAAATVLALLAGAAWVQRRRSQTVEIPGGVR